MKFVVEFDLELDSMHDKGRDAYIADITYNIRASRYLSSFKITQVDKE